MPVNTNYVRRVQARIPSPEPPLYDRNGYRMEFSVVKDPNNPDESLRNLNEDEELGYEQEEPAGPIEDDRNVRALLSRSPDLTPHELEEMKDAYEAKRLSKKSTDAARKREELGKMPAAERDVHDRFGDLDL